jgi:hypothetical protein
MRSSRLLPLIASVGLVACGGAGGPSSTPSANQLSLKTGTFQVPAGGDWFECFYTDVVTDKELIVGNVTAQQGPGGHHIIVYYVDNPEPAEHHECKDSEMVSWHQIAGAANGGEPAVTLPPSTGMKVPAGKQIVVQSHYINTSGATETVDDTIGIDLLDAKDVKAFLNNWVINDAGFSIPPQSQSKSATACTVAQDLQSVIMLGHMHEYGARHTLERVDAQGNSLEVLYDHTWQPQYASHPPLRTATLDAPFVIPAGTIIRQTCEWNNVTPSMLTFPTEMCAGVVYYFPDNGFQVCDNHPVTP